MGVDTFIPVVKPTPGTSMKASVDLNSPDFSRGLSRATRNGLFHAREEISLTWEGLTEIQLISLRSFVEKRKGAHAFYYWPRGHSAPKTWVCREWTYSDDAPWRLSMKLVEKRLGNPGRYISVSNGIEPYIDGRAITETLVVINNGAWIGDGPVTFSYQWMVDGVDIVGATTPTLAIPHEYNDTMISCRVTGTDGKDTVTVVTQQIGLVGLILKPLTDPVVTGTARVGQVLTVSDGTWQSEGAATFTYEWFRDGVSTGEVGNTIDLLNDMLGAIIRCDVTALDNNGSVTLSTDDILIGSERTILITSNGEQFVDSSGSPFDTLD